VLRRRTSASRAQRGGEEPSSALASTRLCSRYFVRRYWPVAPLSLQGLASLGHRAKGCEEDQIWGTALYLPPWRGRLKTTLVAPVTRLPPAVTS
jgi:hypothetical protein